MKVKDLLEKVIERDELELEVDAFVISFKFNGTNKAGHDVRTLAGGDAKMVSCLIFDQAMSLNNHLKKQKENENEKDVC